MWSVAWSFLRRGWFIAAVSLILILPFSWQISGLGEPLTINHNRALAARPDIQKLFGDFAGWRDDIEAFVNDHFGLRSVMMVMNAQFRAKVLGESSNEQILFGDGGRWFLIAPKASHFRRLCGLMPMKPPEIAIFAEALEATLATAEKYSAHAVVGIVPTSIRVHYEDLPSSLEPLCQEGTVGIAEQAENIAGEVGAGSALLYPINEFRRLEIAGGAFLRKRFHWAKNDPLTLWMARYILHHGFGMEGNFDFEDVSRPFPTDLIHLIPGDEYITERKHYIFSRGRVTRCHPRDCYPGVRERHPNGDGDWIRNSNRQGKLLIISDSFGLGIREMFSYSFGEILHIAMNSIPSPQAGEELKKWLMEDFRPSHVLILMHDGNIINFARSFALSDNGGQADR